MIIKGKDRTKPVLLYVHGGMPDYFLTEKYPTGLDEDFVVVWWDQRGAGLSYQPGVRTNATTAEQFVSDIIAVTNHLRQRFGKQKIYLMAHSGGTFTALQAVAQTPALYAAYIGVAQMANQLRSEMQAHAFLLKRFGETGNKRMVRRLVAAPVTATGGTPKACLALRDGAMHRLGIGTMRNMRSVVSGLFLPSLKFREYTVADKYRLWRAKAGAGVSVLWQEMLATDLVPSVPEVAVPVYFVHGAYDYTCSYTEANAYWAALKAPVNGFYTFANSAHSPLFEEPEKMRRIMRDDVLTGQTTLADR